MRNDMHEIAAAARSTSRRAATGRALPASAVDAALDDTAATTPTAGRREMHASEAGRLAMDGSHSATSGANAEGGLLRQLSRQLALLEVQQQQLRQLLDLTEQRYARDAR
jgi:hypothetical protein